MRIREMLNKIGLYDPYKGFEAQKLVEDLQGWASTHPYFATFIDETQAEEIIEVGTWKGASAISMARHATSAVPGATILCIDTWLGSSEIWADDTLRPLLNIRNGRS